MEGHYGSARPERNPEKGTSMTTSCDQILCEIRKNMPANYALALSFDGFCVLVHSNEQAVHKALASYFKAFAKPLEICTQDAPDCCLSVHQGDPPAWPVPLTLHSMPSGKRNMEEEYAEIPGGRIVHKRATGMCFVFSQHEHLAVGPCLGNINQLVNFINSRIIAHYLDHGYYLGRAAAVALHGKALALAGFSGTGKSTLALGLMNHGCTFISNDRVLLSAEGELRGIPKQPRINPGTLLNNAALAHILSETEKERFQAVPSSKLWQIKHRYDAFIDQCYGPERFTLSACCAGLVVLNWVRGGGKMFMRAVNPMERPSLVKAFYKNSGLFYLGTQHLGAPILASYARRLCNQPAYEITGGVNFEKAAVACMKLLEPVQARRPEPMTVNQQTRSRKPA